LSSAIVVLLSRFVWQLPGKHTVASFVKPPDLHHLQGLYLDAFGFSYVLQGLT
jgi:hypothetical protein